MDSGSTYWIPDSVLVESNLVSGFQSEKQVSRFLELKSDLESPGYRFRLYEQKFPGFRNTDCLTWGNTLAAAFLVTGGNATLFYNRLKTTTFYIARHNNICTTATDTRLRILSGLKKINDLIKKQ